MTQPVGEDRQGGQFGNWVKAFIRAFSNGVELFRLIWVILGRILVFFGLVAILHAGYSAVQCKYFVLNKELSEIKHKHLHRLYYCNGANVKLSLYLKYRDLFIPFHNFSMSQCKYSQPLVLKFICFFLCLGRTYYKLLEEEFPGLPADVRTRP